jgi:nucleotide-binding universal stress UspA family protein
MELELILIAVDALNGRNAPFERALALALSSGAELYLLHAVPASRPFSFRAAERLESMADMRKRAEDAGVRVQSVEQHGDPAEIIELHADARAVDLIVMGSEARSRWGGRRSLVAERVIRRTSLPTLVVASEAADTASPFRIALVAVDLSPGSKDFVGGLEAARRTAEAVVSAVPAGTTTRVQVSTGTSARVILEQAADMSADLVVVGRRPGFKVFGSTALRVLRRNNRALLVVPTASRRSGQVVSTSNVLPDRPS